MNYNWCHNPDCHKIQTQSRVRGSGDNKVLRTVKIKVGRYNYRNDNMTWHIIKHDFNQPLILTREVA